MCVLLKEVKNEIEVVARGKVLKEMSFLKKITLIPQREYTFQDRKKVDQWAIDKMKNTLEEKEGGEAYRQRKQRYLEEADPALIFYAFESPETRTVVSEESRSRNDGKLFDKIPEISDKNGIKCTTLPEFLKEMKLGVEYALPEALAQKNNMS